MGSMVIAGPVPGWKTKTHKRYISKDRSLLKELEEALRGSERTSTSSRLFIPLVIYSTLRHRNRSLFEPAATLLFTDCSPSRASESISYHVDPNPCRIHIDSIIFPSAITPETVQHDQLPRILESTRIAATISIYQQAKGVL
jgi:hypothetical protein